ncbi:nucleoside permease [Haliscomenobacter hydrossis]|uniref:Nucleoside:H symporter n=1 Tax=Haliscomenobacter hydrossis (strain ATCC 27775 / DSM 1100 / LMG 10767 / O) TaxID=760192 RepID=F4KXB6_HALH1|nr:nucleoside permease [Haliscomenobacter hydrossis]AEE49324.1 nucleoside:H symporter [Haliscomenobacter hydrossis DSM 1100]
MSTNTRFQLMVMMFLEFLIWGSWYVTMGTYLGTNLQATGVQIGLAYQTVSIGAIIAPFFIGLIADRFFPAQRILGVLHLLGAVVLYLLGQQTTFTNFYPLILIYMLLYMPTLALVNAVAFKQMSDTAKEFPPVRVLGTIGWIVVGNVIAYLALEKSQSLDKTFLMGAGTSAILGVYSFFLPNTPPPKSKDEKISVRDILGLEALGMLKNPSYLIFFIGSILVCIPLSFYYNFANPFLNEAGMVGAAGKMSWGQISEIGFMLVLPVALVRYGIKKILLVGMLAWMLRYVCFAYGDAGANYWMLILGIILHGVCYDFFFVTGQIYTEQQAGVRFKSSAQGMITLATYGIGMFIGSYISGYVVDMYNDNGVHNWTSIWMVPAGLALVILLGFAFFFKSEKK